MVAHVNSTLGFVETGVGLVPGGGGCQAVEWGWVQDPEYIITDDEAALRDFDILGDGLKAHSPLQTKKRKSFLRNDVKVLNRANLLIAAFRRVFEVKGDYQTPLRPQVCLSGLELKEKMPQHLLELEKTGFLFGYDVEIGLHWAHELRGSEPDKTTTLSEEDLNNLEQHSLINFRQSQKTRDRIHAMLLNGRRR